MDALATEVQFVAHLAPVWRALEQPGTFWITPDVAAEAAKRGIRATVVEHARVDERTAQEPLGSGPCLVASYGDNKKARRVGYGPIAFLEHGIGQSYLGPAHGSYAGGEDRDDVGLFLVPNAHAAGRWHAAYPDARVEIVGSPRIDELPRGPRRADSVGTDAVVAVTFHWTCTLYPETMPAFAHFRGAIAELARARPVIGHAHPRMIDRLAGYYARNGIELVRDFDDVCERADVLIADNTSAMYEFASTGRPVVVMNPPWYRRDVHHGLRFWDAAHVGLQVSAPGELAQTVERALEDPHPEDREDALSIVYGLRTNGAAAAATALRDWLASIPVPA